MKQSEIRAQIVDEYDEHTASVFDTFDTEQRAVFCRIYEDWADFVNILKQEQSWVSKSMQESDIKNTLISLANNEISVKNAYNKIMK